VALIQSHHHHLVAHRYLPSADKTSNDFDTQFQLADEQSRVLPPAFGIENRKYAASTTQSQE